MLLKGDSALFWALYFAFLHVTGPAHGADYASDPSSESVKSPNGDSIFNSNIMKADNLEILYVMDPNSRMCFEEVVLDGYARRELLPWIQQLKDEFTRTEAKTDGNDLRVSV
jgi:hypothetical protein